MNNLISFDIGGVFEHVVTVDKRPVIFIYEPLNAVITRHVILFETYSVPDGMKTGYKVKGKDLGSVANKLANSPYKDDHKAFSQQISSCLAALPTLEYQFGSAFTHILYFYDNI